MLKHSRTLVSLAAAGALLAIPAAGLANENANKGKGKAKGKAASCAKAHKAPFVVHGTIASITPDDPATTAINEAAWTMTIHSANAHARKSGELTDMDTAKKGVQARGGTYAVAAGDAYTLKLNGFEGTDTPSIGDRVKVRGTMTLAKKRCAPPAMSTADRYGNPDVTKVTISDRDADA
ncbi:MAG TPA: hypothetical protein VNA28_02395 [Solirubrobacteraceae bacterium]|nr:hypothetical protein [Solirubrobacteraceae bacterium]